MILTTTSKSPTLENRKKARGLAAMIPNSEYQPRGQRTVQRMVDLARKKGYGRVVIFNKKPAVIKAIIVGAKDWKWHPKTLNIKDIKISSEKVDYLKCGNKFLIDFFDIISEDSEYELIGEKTWQIKKFQQKPKKN